MAAFREIERCRVSGTSHLVPVLNLGTQALTGVFPKSKQEKVSVAPLELVWCPGCGLLQLKHSFEPTEMYGENYGYRSGLNQSMVSHLAGKVSYLERIVRLKANDIVLDIGSNDSTCLQAYRTSGLQRMGIDPTGRKFAHYYPKDIKLIPEFFSAEAYRAAAKDPARVITSIAMFYDLEQPVAFAKDVASILSADGVWHFEQSYMPSMLRLTSYDTICHEHLEYYSLQVVQRILDAADLMLADVGMNSVNGGSFAVTAVHKSNRQIRRNRAVIDWMLEQEHRIGLTSPRPFREFEDRVFKHREDLTRLVRSLRADGKTVLGYGASTKGNVVLQFCGLTNQDILAIAEVNEDKFGSYTPGTQIPIISEPDARAMDPDYFLVLPWHFKEGILRREKEFIERGGKMIFPFPEIEIV